MRGSWAASCLLSCVVFSVATNARAQHLETTPAAVVDSRTAEIAYRTLTTEGGADASELGFVSGVGPTFDLGVVAPRPIFATHQPQSSDAGLTLRHLLHGANDGPSLLLAASGSAARPLGDTPTVLLAASHATRNFAWHANLGFEGEVVATTRVEGPQWWRFRPALELKQRALVVEALGVGALMQVSDRIAIDAGARFPEATLSPTFGAGLTYVLPNSESGT
jgi:hypothetical protein